jgi:hypothetical protein
LEQIVAGPSANHLLREATPFSRSLTEKLGVSTWQHECAVAVDSCLRRLIAGRAALPSKVGGRRWIGDFVELRNKTRGHGAVTAAQASEFAPLLEKALRLFCTEFTLFDAPWAFLHQNLSGKYRISPIGGETIAFKPLSSKPSASIPDGVYLYFDRPRKVELFHSDPDLQDFFFPNGAFDGKRYELFSYLTNTTRYDDASPYLAPAQPLPPSQTEGLSVLDAQGAGFGNVPPTPRELIDRRALEEELSRLLLDDRHPIISLYGPGGIGKTSLALKCINGLENRSPFVLTLWFSARDIELLSEGPKPVQPHVLTIEDIAKEFVRLLKPDGADDKQFKSLDSFRTNLSDCSRYGKTLFVFDNFETVRNLSDVYVFIDTNIRLPNKALITTRIRDFRGDFPIEVAGMDDEEGGQLIDLVARSLGITALLTDSYRQEMLAESEGHPYVIKILLGEVAKARHLTKVSRVVASQDHVLVALFERTYQSLSIAAKRVFLTLCSWRSIVPLLGLKAVLLRPANEERIDVDGAVEELRRSSMVELVGSGTDSETFLAVPLSASWFGKQKVSVDPTKSAVEADCEILRSFGPTQESDLRHGVNRTVISLFRSALALAKRSEQALTEYKPVLEFVAITHPAAWILLVDFYEELGRSDVYEAIKQAIINYLQYARLTDSERARAWERLANAADRAHDDLTAIHAYVEMAQQPKIDYWRISEAANSVNAILRDRPEIEREEKTILVRKLAEVMSARHDEASATDLSRLAWLYLHLGDEATARNYGQMGLDMQPENLHCRRLADRLGF